MTALHYPPVRNFSLHPYRSKCIFQEFFDIPCHLGYGEDMEWTFIKQGCEHEDLRRCRRVFCCSASLHEKTVARLSFKRPIVHRKADGMQLMCNGTQHFPASSVCGTLIGSRALAAYDDVDGPSTANNRPWSRKGAAKLLRRSDARASAHGYGGTHSVQRAGAESVG